MKTDVGKVTPEQIDAHSEELVHEFFEHYHQVLEADPDKNDINVVFHGWAIQKIAGLQLIVLELAQRLNTIGGFEE